MSQQDEITLSGYLFKKTRDGRWQKRWFETNGVYLTYYKSRRREKLLAALSLPQVGEIKMTEDPDSTEDEGLFSLELNTRIYTLKAKSKEDANLWVDTLVRLRDQRMNSFGQNGIESLNIDKSKALADQEHRAGGHWMKSDKSCFCCC